MAFPQQSPVDSVCLCAKLCLSFLVPLIDAKSWSHNLSFDLAMLRPEFDRENIIWRLDEKLMFCAMRASTNWCRLSKLDGRSGYKWPKLDELHYRLFGRYFENSHDALNDVLATKDCFFELSKRKIIVDPLVNACGQEARRNLKAPSDSKSNVKINPPGSTVGKAEPGRKIKSGKISNDMSESTKSLSSKKVSALSLSLALKIQAKIPVKLVKAIISVPCNRCPLGAGPVERRFQ